MLLEYKKYFVLILLFLFVYGFVIVKYFSSSQYNIKDPEKISELPFKTIFDGQNKKLSKTIIIIFSPTCEDCKKKAQQIRKNISDFSQTQILMVSPDDSASIIKFASDSQLNKFSNVRFLHLPKEKIFKTFTTTTVPYILVYNQGGDLNNAFKGDIKIEKLIEMVHQ